MTREEAISIMNVIVHMLEEKYDTDRVEEAVDMAIEALSADSCEDCISRKEAIKAMEDKAKGLKNLDTINGLCGAVAILYDLPSVQLKTDMLDKIRAELHATAEMHEDGDYYLRDEWIDEYFDEYKAESEGKE